MPSRHAEKQFFVKYDVRRPLQLFTKY